MMGVQMTGTVKFYNDAKGFGFITPDDGSKEIFVHISNCADDIDELRESQRVRYEERVSSRNGKPEACAVSIIG
jgi:cold shock protein